MAKAESCSAEEKRGVKYALRLRRNMWPQNGTKENNGLENGEEAALISMKTEIAAMPHYMAWRKQRGEENEETHSENARESNRNPKKLSEEALSMSQSEKWLCQYIRRKANRQ